jgi:ATP-dependent HslUV protease subunit HslV
MFALAAARALAETDMDAETVARRAMAIAADICVYTNGSLSWSGSRGDRRLRPSLYIT